MLLSLVEDIKMNYYLIWTNIYRLIYFENVLLNDCVVSANLSFGSSWRYYVFYGLFIFHLFTMDSLRFSNNFAYNSYCFICPGSQSFLYAFMLGKSKNGHGDIIVGIRFMLDKAHSPWTASNTNATMHLNVSRYYILVLCIQLMRKNLLFIAVSQTIKWRIKLQLKTANFLLSRNGSV